MKFKKHNSFTLIEVLVATAVFAFFLGSVIAALIANAHNGPINQRRLQAANLAREGAQLVTQIRDTAWLHDVNWEGMSLEGCYGLVKDIKRSLTYFDGQTIAIPEIHLEPQNPSNVEDKGGGGPVPIPWQNIADAMGNNGAYATVTDLVGGDGAGFDSNYLFYTFPAIHGADCGGMFCDGAKILGIQIQVFGDESPAKAWVQSVYFTDLSGNRIGVGKFFSDNQGTALGPKGTMTSVVRWPTCTINELCNENSYTENRWWDASSPLGPADFNNGFGVMLNVGAEDWTTASITHVSIDFVYIPERVEFNGEDCPFEHWRLTNGDQQITQDNTTFTREITISDQPIFGATSDNVKLVTVKVKWTEGGEDKDVTVKKILTDWKAI